MTTQYTPILQLALPVTGELNGTWGDVVNDNITSMVEEAIAGLATISTWTTNAHTLTTADGVTDEARCAMLVLQTGAGGTALSGAGQVICPALTKLYVVKNDAAYAVTVKTSGGSGVAIAAGDTAFVFCDGTNVNACVTQIINGHITGNLTVDGNTTLGDSSADTVVINAGSTTLNDGGALRFEDNAGGEYVALKAPATIAASFTLTLPIDDGVNGQALITDGSGNLSWSTAASGDVYGPSSATDNAVARFDGTTGKLIQNSAVTIGDDGATVIAANSTSDGLRITQIGAGNALVVEDSANPDSTPFVINSSGQALIGGTTPYTTGVSTYLQLQGTSGGTSGASLQRWSNDTGAPSIAFAKSRGASIGAYDIVANGDNTGIVSFLGSDGTQFVTAASISSSVDGTPGTNDMPGRLVFSTTADGASSPTERMRITNSGQVGIGGTPSSGYTLQIAKTMTGGTLVIGTHSSGTIQSDATSEARYYSSFAGTQAASFTLPLIKHFTANQGTIGAGSTVTSQVGFHVDSSLTGATNNYGFYSNIASGTGRWNFYAAGSADNYFAGNVGIGTSSPATGVRLDTFGGYFRLRSNTTINADISGNVNALVFESSGGTGEHAIIAGGNASQNFLSFYTANTAAPAERMRIDYAGNVGIGTSSPAGPLHVVGTSDQIRAGNGTVTSFLGGSGSIGYTGTLTNHSFTFFTNSAERMRIDSSGNLLVGTTSQYGTAKISVNGNVNVLDDGYVGAGTGGGAGASFSYRSGASGYVVGFTNGTERMRIDSSGNVVLKTGSLQEVKTAIAASDINLSTGNYFTKTISGATTFTVSNVPASGTAISFILDLTNGGSATITWWSGMKWAGGTAPTLTASGRDSLGFYTYDGGTTWTGLVLGKDIK